MAEKVLINKSILTDIGNAIREKEESIDLIPSTEMATRIRDFQGGAKIVSGGVEKILKGEYNGDSVSITKPENVNISALIDEQKIPLAVNVDIPTYDGSYENGITSIDMLQKKIDLSKSMAYEFYGNKYKDEYEEYFAGLDTSKVTDFSYCFNTQSSVFYMTKLPSWLNTSSGTNFDYFCYRQEKLVDISNLDISSATSLYNAFYGAGITDISNLDFSKCQNFGMAFYKSKVAKIPNPFMIQNISSFDSAFDGCSQLTGEITIIVSEENTYSTKMGSAFANTNISKLTIISNDKVGNVGGICFNCANLTELHIDSLKGWSISSTTLGPIHNCKNIQNLFLGNIRGGFPIGSGDGTGTNDYGTLLTLDSLINIIKELIIPKNTSDTRTLTMGTANLAKIENVYVKLTGEAEEDENYPKLPCEVCESTDEGAMTIIAYANSKNWTIA